MKGDLKKRRSDHFKVRRRRGSYLTVTGKFPTDQNPHSLFYEGFRERDLFVLLAYNSSVLRVDDHPFSISYQDGKRTRSYKPDAKIEFRADGTSGTTRRPLVVEVKVEAELQRNAEELRPKFDAATAFCKKNDMDFLVVTEKILSRPAVRNLRFLFRYRKQTPAPSLTKAIKERLSGEPKTLSTLIEDLESPEFPIGKIIAAVWHLASIRTVAVPLEQPLSIQSALILSSWSTSI
jgi:hypothetical protein